MTEDDVKERFEPKNIEILFNLLFSDFFENDALACISQEILRLTALLSPELKSSFDEDVLLHKKLKMYAPYTPCTKEKLLANCKGELKPQYLPAMLASDPINASYNQEQFDQYKALILHVAIKLILMGSCQGAIKKSCDEIRLFAKGEREDLAAYLPKLTKSGDHHLANLIDDFKTERENLFNSGLSDKFIQTIDSQLAHYQVPLRNAYKSKQGIARNAFTREFTNQYEIVEMAPEMLDWEGEQNFSIKTFTTHKKATEKWEKEENSSTEKEMRILTFKNSDLHHSRHHYGAQAVQARALSDQIIKNKISSSCQISQATTREIMCLLNYCSGIYFCSSEEACPVGKCLLLMLLLGNSHAQISTTNIVRANRDDVINKKHTIPSQTQRPEVDIYLSDINKYFTIILPSSPNNAEQLRNVTKEDVSAALSHINKRYNSCLTQNKVSGFLSHYQKNKGVDPVLTQLISDPDVQKLPALSYTQISLNDLNNAFADFVNYIYSIAPNTAIPRPYIKVNLTKGKYIKIADKPIGSALFISKKILLTLVSKLIERLNKSASTPSCWFSEDHHDLITSYTQMILALSSGYRPVTGWLGKKSDLNLYSGEYYITDKDSLAIGSGRIVIIPPVVIQIVKQYIKFVEMAALHFKNKSIKLSRRYQKVLNSREHLFFYRNTQEKDKLFEESIPTTIILQFNYFPLPPNWHRHQIRTFLHQAKVTPDLIDAWMGHTNIGQTAFSQFSSMSTEDLRSISTLISLFLIKIGVKEIQYVN